MGQSVFLRPEKPQRRVVVTGIGLVTPLGLTVADNWDNLSNGRSGIGKITNFDASEYASQIAGEVKGFDPRSIVDKKDTKKMDRFITFALEATRQAVEDSGIDFSEVELL